MILPLNNLIVLEFCEQLSDSYAGLRLADLGARVIKIEYLKDGDLSRKLNIRGLIESDETLLFNVLNRNKESFSLDFENPGDMEELKKLIAQADVLIHNFKPGSIETLGLDYVSIKAINPDIIYTAISGYGHVGPWKNKPNYDILIQSISGLAYTTGNLQDNPLPFGLVMGDYLCGNQAVQFILASLFRRKRTHQGAFLQLSVLESLIDFQFEFFTTYFQSKRVHQRSAINNAHALLSAPYGIYKTLDGYIGIAMMPLQKLNLAIACDSLKQFSEDDTFKKRDEIKVVLSKHLAAETTQSWLDKMQPYDLWVMPVLSWKELRETKGYQLLRMEQQVRLKNGENFTTTRCPVRINGQLFVSDKSAPKLGEHNQQIKTSLM